MQTVQNINDIKYFLDQFEVIDPSYQFTIDWDLYNIKHTY